MNRLATLLLATLLLGAAPAFAEDAPATGVEWDSLDPDAQEILAGQEERWESLPPEPPDPEFLEFLGETADMDPELVMFMETRQAQRAVHDAAKKAPEEDDDE